MLDCLKVLCHLQVLLGELLIWLSRSLQQEPEQPLGAIGIVLVVIRDVNLSTAPCGVGVLAPQACSCPRQHVLVRESGSFQPSSVEQPADRPSIPSKADWEVNSVRLLDVRLWRESVEWNPTNTYLESGLTRMTRTPIQALKFL
ncbi:hypothetical protein GS500_22625 [Rhodococcus hoagii]|nr:hypothetical protein [Prescottella equi]